MSNHIHFDPRSPSPESPRKPQKVPETIRARTRLDQHYGTVTRCHPTPSRSRDSMTNLTQEVNKVRMQTSGISSKKQENDVVTRMLNDTADNGNIIRFKVFCILQESAKEVCRQYYLMTRITGRDRAAKENRAAKNANFNEVRNTAPYPVSAKRTVHKRWLTKYAHLYKKLFNLNPRSIKDQETLVRYLCRIGALNRGYWHYADTASYP